MERYEQLCGECGLCCDGTLFDLVRLEPGDDARKLKALGLPVTLSRGKARGIAGARPDILAAVAHRANAPFCVGFAAETSDVVRHAREKLERKRADLIVGNDVTQPGAGFETETNAAVLADLKRSLAALSAMPELATHPDPLDVFGFYHLSSDGDPAGADRSSR